MQEKYGFVYIWYDRKHKRFYIGSHWGFEEDGYVCSSGWMKQAYNKRSSDFRRKIISRIFTSRKDLLREEQKWLSLIPIEELGSSYYNLKKTAAGGSAYGHVVTEETRKKIGLKNSEKTKEKSSQFGTMWINDGNESKKILRHEDIPDGWRRGRAPFSNEIRAKMSRSHMGLPSPLKGKPWSEKRRQCQSEIGENS